MLRYIQVNNESLPVDFSIMTAVKIANSYKVDITGISEVFTNLGTLEEQLSFIARVGSIALTEGSLRKAAEEGINPIEAKRYTEYDVLDILTVDLSVSETLLNYLTESFESSKVFQKPQATPVAPKKKKHK